jgi:hypothetical protein
MCNCFLQVRQCSKGFSRCCPYIIITKICHKVQQSGPAEWCPVLHNQFSPKWQAKAIWAGLSALKKTLPICVVGTSTLELNLDVERCNGSALHKTVE